MRTLLPGPVQAVARRIARMARLYGCPPTRRAKPKGRLYIAWSDGGRHFSLIQGEARWHYVFRTVGSDGDGASVKTERAGDFSIPAELSELERTLDAVPRFLEKGELP
jgi:hypothetical protein